MKRTRFFVGIAAVIIAGSAASYARQTVTSDPSQLSVDGGLNGVDITGSHTLLVGVLGGPKLDIYTNNPSPFIGVTAVGSPTGNDQGMVQFNVNSTVDGDMGATTTHVLHNITVGDGTTVNFLGSVYSTTMNIGAATVNFNGGPTATNTVAPNFTGDGMLNLAPNTALAGALTTATDNTGTLSLGGGSQWTGAIGTGPAKVKSINVVGGNNNAGVSAGIIGAVNTHSFSLLTNTLNINGAMTLANNGAINTTLASPTVYGHIVPVGAANYASAVAVNVAVPAAAFIPVGTKFDIVQPQAAGTSGATVTATDPSNPLYTFSATPTSAGLVEIALTGTPVQTVTPTSPGQPGLTTLLNTTVTPDMMIVLAAINALSDAAAVNNAVSQLGPAATSLGAPLVTFQEARAFQNLWLTHLNACGDGSESNSDTNNCEAKGPRRGWWVKGFGQFGQQNDRDNREGYKSTLGGTMLAYDVPLGVDTRAGLGVGYAHSDLEGNTNHSTTDINTYQGTAYIGHDQGLWFVNGSQTFGWNKYSSTRPIMFPGIDRTANADNDGQAYTTMAHTGVHLAAPQKITVTPHASLQYSRVNIDGYTETGAGDINLSAESQGYNFLESGLGTKAERAFHSGRLAFVPEVHVEWLHDLLSPTLEQSTVFTAPGSASFTTRGLKTDRNTYHVGTGLTLLSCACSTTQLSAEGVYDYYWTAEGYSAHQVTMRLTQRF